MSEITRTEKFLRACIDGEPCKLKPLTRMEKLLAELNETLAGGPSEVVILPETELVPVEVTPGESGIYNIINVPFENKPVAGSTGKLVWGGVEYTSKAVDVSALMDMPEGSMLCMGNLAVLGETPPGIENPIPDAPFLLMMYPDGMPANTDIGYGQMMSVGITPEPPVLSIVQTEGAASDGDADSPVVIAKLTNAGGTYSIDKTFDEIASLAKSGKIVYLHNVSGETAMMMPLANYTGTSTPKRLVFSALIGGKMGVVVTYTPDGVTMEMENY